jgi:N-acetylglucosaminyl-diphospho-decaprenol L-rhamnosyltransferase
VTVSVAIVNWNTGHRLKKCVASVLSTAPGAEIVIVDNASTDASLDSVGDFRNQIDIVRNSVNRGFAAAVNQAVSQATTPYALILNPDIVVAPGAVRLLEEFIDAHPRAAAVGGYVNDRYLPRDLPTPVSLIAENLGFGGPRRVANVHDTIEVDQPAAAALMIRKDAYEGIGGFDERFFPAWYEDVDFCLRLKEAGWTIYYVPAAKFEHEGGYSTAALGAKEFADAYYHNQLRYARKHFSLLSVLALRISIIIGMFLRIVRRPGMVAAYGGVVKGAVGGWS